MKRHTDQQQVRGKLARSSQKRRQQLLASLTAAGVASTGSLAHADITTTLNGVMPTVNNEEVPTDHGSTAETTLTWSTATPEEQMLHDWDQYADWDGRGDVYQVENRMSEITFSPTAANITVTVQSFDLDEWHYDGGEDNKEVDWIVTGSSSGVLAMGKWDLKNAANDPGNMGGRDTISPNATGVAGETLTLAFDHYSGYISYLAMDNLTFLSEVAGAPGDFDGDGDVDGRDFLDWQQGGSPDPLSPGDLSTWETNYGSGPLLALNAVPEPATTVLAWLGVSGLGALAMRRKRS